MKRIVALIPKETLMAVQSALVALDVGGLTVETVQCQGASSESQGTFLADAHDMLRLELLTHAAAVESLLEAIRVWVKEEAFHPRGMIWVLPLESMVRIRTGARDHAAI